MEGSYYRLIREINNSLHDVSRDEFRSRTEDMSSAK